MKSKLETQTDATIYYNLERYPPIKFNLYGIIRGIGNMWVALADFLEYSDYHWNIESVKRMKKNIVQGCKSIYRMQHIDEIMKNYPIISFDNRSCSFTVDNHNFQNIDDAQKAAKMKAFL